MDVSKAMCRQRGWTGALHGNFTSVLTTDLLSLACAILVREPQNGKESVRELVGVLYAAQIVQVRAPHDHTSLSY